MTASSGRSATRRSVRINKLGPKGVNLYVKVEAFNPLGSVKDRLALGVIEAAEKSGDLKPGQTVIEATSGNTGIGLAMVCAAKGYPLVVTMAESFSVERRKLMRFLGAKVVLTPAPVGATGHDRKDQGAGRGQWLVHDAGSSRTTPIRPITPKPRLRKFSRISRRKLDYWVTGFGTGGTLKGVAGVLRKERPGHQGHRRRAGGRADAHLGTPSRRATRMARPPRAMPHGSRIRSRAGAPTSCPRSPAMRWREAHRRGDGGQRSRGHEDEPAAGAEGRHLRRHHARGRPSPRR